MNKYDFIREIGELFDENERLNAEKKANEALAEQRNKACESQSSEYVNPIEDVLINIGARKLVDDAYKYVSVAVSRNDETGNLLVDSYERWKKRSDIDVPGCVARDEMLVYLEPKITALYDEKKGKAIAAFEEAESDE